MPLSVAVEDHAAGGFGKERHGFAHLLQKHLATHVLLLPSRQAAEHGRGLVQPLLQTVPDNLFLIYNIIYYIRYITYDIYNIIYNM